MKFTTFEITRSSVYFFRNECKSCKTLMSSSATLLRNEDNIDFLVFFLLYIYKKKARIYFNNRKERNNFCVAHFFLVSWTKELFNSSQKWYSQRKRQTSNEKWTQKRQNGIKKYMKIVQNTHVHMHKHFIWQCALIENTLW